MEASRIDKGTGEVIDEVTTTVSINGGDPIPLEEFESRVEQVKENAHRQLRLIDGIVLDKLRTEIMAGPINEVDLGPDTDIPRYMERRYFVLSAQAQKLLVKHKETSDDIFDIKIVGFKPEDIVEIDMLSFERCVRQAQDEK